MRKYIHVFVCLAPMMSGHVEVAGGGIGGLAAGLAFARRGWSVRVHEQDRSLRILGAGIYISENGLGVLESLGVLDRAIEGAIPAWRRERRDRNNRPFTLDECTPNSRLYVPLRRTLLNALFDALIEAGGEVVFNSQIVGATADGDVVFSDGKTCRADLVIGADGINSRVRESLGLLKSRRHAGQFGYRAMIERLPDELQTQAGRAHCEHWNGTRRLLYAPCTADQAYVQLTSTVGDVVSDAPFERSAWLASFPHLSWIIERIPSNGKGDWFEIVRLHDWSRGRVALIGDAASAQPPFLGQGGGCAMMSGLSLAHCISETQDVLSGISLWKKRERRFVEWVQTVSFWYGQLAFLPPPMRRAAFRLVVGNAWLRRRTIMVAAFRNPTGTQSDLPPHSHALAHAAGADR